MAKPEIIGPFACCGYDIAPGVLFSEAYEGSSPSWSRRPASRNRRCLGSGGGLLKAGLLAGRRVGRLHFVKPNEASPYFPELAVLLLKVFGPRSVLAERLADLDGVEEAYLFGSWARRYEVSRARRRET